MPLAAKLIAAAAIMGILWWLSTEPERRAVEEASRAKAAAQAAAAKASAVRAGMRVECSAKLAGLLAEYTALLASPDPKAAANLIRPCATTLQTADLQEKVKAADIAAHKLAIADPKLSARERAASIDAFSQAFPVEAKEFDTLRAQLDAQVKKEDEVRERQVRQRELARRKSEGVSIGMSQEDVRQSSWGRPERVNRSVYSFGVREQWVYGNGNYLYFEDGRLTSIQTANTH
jgi:hypothetical protein